MALLVYHGPYFAVADSLPTLRTLVTTPILSWPAAAGEVGAVI